jgi:NADH-quinone oxidoreductase subunit L
MFGIELDGIEQRTLVWIVLLPLFGALVNGVLGKRSEKWIVSTLAVGSVFGAFLLALISFGFLLYQGTLEHGQHAIVQDIYEWFSIDVRDVGVPIHVRFVMDHLSGLMTVMVTGIASLIHLYSVGYMSEDPGYARFMTYLNLFTASMLVLVLASSLPLMFVGWEGVGLCSYLLIGFWYQNKEYAAAGRKAFVVNRIGDFGVLIGMFLLVSEVTESGFTDAFEFAQINAVDNFGFSEVVIGDWATGASVATVAGLFIFLGCAGKSAQIPLYTWLPDAMAGPTPVSALIHAATMVTAGVYLCARLSPVLAQSTTAMAVIAIVGALTALLAASIALVQNQMKRILAYSTVSQLGFMFAAIGMGAFSAGMFHVFTHAFFKACLFLGAGSVMHAVHAHGDADIRYLGGLKKWMPVTRWTFLVSTLAIAGIFPLSGFFSKDEILLGAAFWGHATQDWTKYLGWVVFGLLLITAAMTAFYMFRLYFRTFEGEFKGGHAPDHDAHHDDDDDDDEHEPHESPESMTIPLGVLAAGAAIVGFLGLPHAFGLPSFWHWWFEPVEADHFREGTANAIAAATAANQQITQPEAMIHALRGMGTPFVPEFEFMVNMEPAHVPMWLAGLAMALGLLAALGGAGLAYVIYMQRDGAPAESMKNSVPGLHKVLLNKWYVDEAYGSTIVLFNKWLGVFAANFDRFVIDGLLAKLTALGVKAGGYALTRTQTGAVYAYAAMFVVGLAVLGWWFTYPHPSLEGESRFAELERLNLARTRGNTTVEGRIGELQSAPREQVTWRAGEGLGYEYRWDFGNGEEEWTTESTVSRRYAGPTSPYFGMVAVFEAGGVNGFDDDAEIVLDETDAPAEIPLSRQGVVDPLGLGEGGAEEPPTVAYRRVTAVRGQVDVARRPKATVEIAFYDQIEGGSRLWGPEELEVHVDTDGEFVARLGEESRFPERWQSPNVYSEVRVNGEPSGTRQFIPSAPTAAYDFRARLERKHWPRLPLQFALWEHDAAGRYRPIDWRGNESDELGVLVGEDGSYTVLLGSETSLPGSIAQIIERAALTESERDGVFVQVDDAPPEQRIQLSEAPQPSLLFRVNGSNVADSDGTNDGIIVLSAGEQLQVSNGTMFAAVRVRATVEVRSVFGNLGRSTEEVTLRLDQGRRRPARAEVRQ